MISENSLSPKHANPKKMLQKKQQQKQKQSVRSHSALPKFSLSNKKIDPRKSSETDHNFLTCTDIKDQNFLTRYFSVVCNYNQMY